MKTLYRGGVVVLLAGLLVSGAAFAQAVRPVLQRSGEAAALPSDASNMKVTFDQARLKKWPNSSLLTVPFRVTYDTSSRTGVELGAGDHLAAYNLKVLDKSPNGTLDYEIYGAAKDADKLYLSGGTAESRFLVQRLKYCWDDPPDAVRVMLLFDLSSSVESSIRTMRSEAPKLVDALFADATCVDKHDLKVAVAWFSGQVEDLDRIKRATFFSKSEVAALKNLIGQEIQVRPRGSSTGLVDAAHEALLALNQAVDTSQPPCALNPRENLKVLITATDFVHRTGEPSAAKLAALTSPAPPRFLTMGITVPGEAANFYTTQLMGALAAGTGGTPYSSWATAIQQAPGEICRQANDEPEKCEYEYLLHTCVAPRDLRPFTPVENRSIQLDLSYGGLNASGTFSYNTADLKDGCFLWAFDRDQDGFVRNIALDGTDGLDKYVYDTYLRNAYLEKIGARGRSCLAEYKISVEDEDRSGCLPNPAVAECQVKINCTIENCKFGNECDQDGVLDDNLHLKVDRCPLIHPKIPYLPGEKPNFADLPDCSSRWVINREPPPDERCENGCPGNCASDRYYCGNRIDENADGRDEKCPPPPAPAQCSDANFPPADSTLDQALARSNTFIIPDARRGLVGGSSWKTDLRVIADGPAPGTEEKLNPCCWDLNCARGTDGFFHAVSCPRSLDVNGDHEPDTCGFCYVEQPWVELFFLPAQDNQGSSTVAQTPLSRKFCLPTNGALPIEDVLAQFRTAAGIAPDNVAGMLVVSSNYNLLLQNRKIITSDKCGRLEPCPRHIVEIDRVATVDAGARTYNAAGFGKRVSAAPVGNSFGPTDVAHLYHVTGPDRANRNADIGIVNLTPNAVAFYVRYFHADGALIETKEWNVGPRSVAWIQNTFTAGKAGYDIYASVQVVKPQGNEKWLAWASSIETTTGDQFFIEPGPFVEGTAGGTLYLPNAAREVITADERYIITDVELVNLEDRLLGGAPATVSYWLASAPARKKTVSLLQAGKAYRLIDLIADGLNFATGVANDTLVIEVPQQSAGKIGASSYTYQLDIVKGTPNSSSFGAGVTAVPATRLVGANGRVRVPLFGGSQYDSALVITNPTADSVSITVRFLGAMGFPYSTRTYTLAAGQKQVIPDPEDRRAGTAVVTVAGNSTGRVLVHLKVTDVTKNDHFVLVGR
ncbi:MAG: hypothetical protein HRF46_02160 [Acidobacteriota bacterium]|jgi:hypothetical protein